MPSWKQDRVEIQLSPPDREGRQGAAFPGKSGSDFDAHARFSTGRCRRNETDIDLLVHLALRRSPKLRRLAVHLSRGETSLKRSSPSPFGRSRFGMHPVGAVRASHRSRRRHRFDQFNAETRCVSSAVRRRGWRHGRWDHEHARPGGPPWLFRLLLDDRVPPRETTIACVAVAAAERGDVAG